ncbi:MAG: SIR2 family protein [Candidatus Thiodiazotropha taylori]|nr:SIR2 family protein [Candidatus Thiodiazotropha taylori]
MDFLKEDFLDQLRAEIDEETGRVIIEAAEFTPQQILQEISEITFNEAFEEWKLNRKEANLEKAEEIIGENNNRNRFNTLKTRFESCAVIPFVGAGLSMSSGYSGWTSYLHNLVGESDADRDEFTRLMGEFEYEAAAQLIFDAMGHARFNEELENEYGQDRTITGPIRLLPYLFKTGVITTNFDSVLKRCFDDSSKPFDEVLLGQESVELQRYLGEEKKILVKLHGKATSANSRILTQNEYDKHYENDEVLKRCIKAITCKTLLFIGCSLGSDRTIKKMKEIVAAEGHDCMPRHYAFMRLDEEIDRVARAHELAEANIYPIWYTDDHDQSIEALLQKMAEDVEI